jgi:hypothetical protein
MLTEFVVEGGKSVDPLTWMSTLLEVGITCELDPGFDIYADEGFLNIRWQRANEPAIAVGFDLALGMPAPDLGAELFAKVIGRYERMLANLRASKLPPTFAETMAKKLVELRAPKRTQYLRVRVESKDSRPGDYAAAALCSGAYAARSGGTLSDRDNGKRYTGSEALTAMASSKYVAMPGENVAFTTWKTKKPKKPKKPAAKRRA